ncbi:MAG TPA: GMC family oxidoreductase [Candidatus Dormibacteraeota bacterium]
MQLQVSKYWPESCHAIVRLLLSQGGGERDDDIVAAPPHEANGQAPRTAVGRNLIDHPQIGVNLLARPGMLRVGDPLYQVALRFTALGSLETDDMQLYLLQFPESDTLRLSAVLQRPRSRGSLRLAGTDPHAPPLIELNLADDREDVRRLSEGMRLIWQVAQSPRLAQFLEGTATLDDGTVLPLAEVIDTLGTDAALERYVARGVSEFYHPVGTARMGPGADSNAAVDQYCRVRGVENLRIVDASVMPNITRANTNLTCIMIAERVADWLRSEA